VFRSARGPVDARNGDAPRGSAVRPTEGIISAAGALLCVEGWGRKGAQRGQGRIQRPVPCPSRTVRSASARSRGRRRLI
jgi:hypothetical protein